MTISRMQQPRQNYGLGSLVKSIGKGIKKFTKSGLGKAAIGAALTFGLPGASGFLGKGLMGTKAGLGLKSLIGLGAQGPGAPMSNSFGMAKTGFLDKVGNFLGSPLGKAAGIIIPSVMAAAGVKEKDMPKEDTGEYFAALERGYRNLNPGVSDEEVSDFLRTYQADGGRIGYAMGSPEENAIQASGIMGLPLNENPAGVTELDLRETGGFIPPVGVKEKADDIPAMLSNNEFVFTADSVREMGDGDVEKGAERMYAMMKTLENGGRV